MKARRKSLHIQNSDSPIFSGTQQLLDSETALIGYTTSIVEKFHKYLNLQQRVIEHHGKLLEFGAGTGFLAEIFRQKFKISPVCVELSWSGNKKIYTNNEHWGSLGRGWSRPENWGTWTDGRTAELVLPQKDLSNALMIELDSTAFLPFEESVLKVDVFYQQFKVGCIQYSNKMNRQTTKIVVPFEIINENRKPTRLTFEIYEPTSPSTVSESIDNRKLGLGLFSIRNLTNEAS